MGQIEMHRPSNRSLMSQEEYDEFMKHIDDPKPDRVVDTEMDYDEEDELVYPDEVCDDSETDADIIEDEDEDEADENE